MKAIELTLPLDDQTIRSLKYGEKFLLSGTIYTARDQAHARMADMIAKGEDIPIPLKDTAIFYCGPAPVPPGKVSGAIGPTTSARMDRYTPLLLDNGLRIMIGKGGRSAEVEAAIKRHGALYMVCVGGISALLTRCVVSRETYLWPELGSEAVYRLEVKDLPCYVAIV
jgi:fumarate hydratase subunit beta